MQYSNVSLLGIENDQIPKSIIGKDLARGVRLCLAIAASEAMTTAPAPSQMPEAEPAVTTPPATDGKDNF